MLSPIACRDGYSPANVTFLQYGADFCLGEPLAILLIVVLFTHRFMAMVVIEFGGLNKLADAARNYHCNINKLYGNLDEFTLTISKVMHNIVVLMYAHYIDQGPINSACVGH